MPRLATLVLSTLLVAPLWAEPQPTLTAADADVRLRKVDQLVRLKNDAPLITRVKETAAQVKEQLATNHPDEAERLIADLERAAGIEPGGAAMSGRRIFHPTQDQLTAIAALRSPLDAAMRAGDVARVRAIIAQHKQIVGEQAGLPDDASPGLRAPPHPLTEAQAVDFFLAAIDSEKKSLRTIAEGKPVAVNMVRFYASIVKGLCDARPGIAKLHPERLDDVDKVVAGACSFMLSLQQPAGFFPFPDLRGKNVRWGEMTDRIAATRPDAIKDGWIIIEDPTGGSQFDTGEAGVALLAAAETYKNAAWQAAGLKAADWALGQPCCVNFNYNSFSVHLLARAYAATGRAEYLDAAIAKWQIGVAPGQLDTGRWIDSHNAKTVYHVIMLRATLALEQVVPPERAPVRDELKSAAARATRSLVDEFESAGVTTSALPELLTQARLDATCDSRLRATIEAAASVAYAKCARDGRVRIGTSLDELVALSGAWR